MPLIKIRGKSATPIRDDPSRTLLTISPSPQSLLKIESVIPTYSRKNNQNKSIYRSYSTLSTTYFRKDVECKDINGEKSNLSSAGLNTHNGFWRIQRSLLEKEKLPDRINLDRRGLTTLPYIEDEPNLRLLSLQHNLINSFWVPEVTTEKSTIPTIVTSSRRSHEKRNGIEGVNQYKTTSYRNYLQNKISNRRLIGQKSISNIRKPVQVNQNGPIKNSLNYPTTNNSLMKSSFIQKSVLLHAKEKYILKKSNSFINNYSQHLAASKIHLGRLMNKNNGLINMSSFSSDSTSHDNTDLLKGQTSTSASPNKITQTNTFTQKPPDSLIVQNDINGTMISSECLQNIVFLDLYNNQIEKISNLDGLKNLTVLLLGKNRITDISGIVSVKQTLRVLDLHGNKVANIANKITQLQELKSLNLAGNCLKQINPDDLKGLFNLKELNLKRNRIKRINGFDDLRNLERLWLCNNDIQRIEDMSCIAKSINLKEVTVESNPVSLGGDCVSFLVSYLPSLAMLSQMQVTEKVRRAAMAWRKSKEISDSSYTNLSNDIGHSVRREEIISNARTNWELLQNQQQISNSSSYIHKSLQQNSTNLHQHSIPVSDLGIDLYSNLSDNIRIDRKLLKPKTMRRTSAKPIKRSLSQNNQNIDNKVISVNNQTGEPNRLHNSCSANNEENSSATNERQNVNSSGSSLGPNVDSCSSYHSSDNEEHEMNNETNMRVPNAPSKILDTDQNEHLSKKIEENHDNDKIILEINNGDTFSNLVKLSASEDIIAKIQLVNVSKEPVIELPAPTIKSNVLELSDVKLPQTEMNQPSPSPIPDDKLSNISIISNKSTTDSSMLTCQSDISQKCSSKCKSAMPNRKTCNPSLVRAQTAKNVSQINNNICQSKVQSKPPLPIPSEREREQGGDYLIEICGRYLNVYGAGAIKFIDRQWNVQKANDVHTIKFSYVNFNNIVTILNRIKSRFTNAEHYVFRETNITNLGQLNGLAEIQGITTLVIDTEGNEICTKHWRLYAIYRLTHWGLKTINGIDVTESEINEANLTYSGLSDLVIWSLPDSLLEPLLARLRLEETCTASKLSTKQWLVKADPSLKTVVGKEALQWKRTNGTGSMSPDELTVRNRGRTYFTTIIENTCNAIEKLQMLETLWPNLLTDMIRDTLLDYTQMDEYIKSIMDEFSKAN